MAKNRTQITRLEWEGILSDNERIVLRTKIMKLDFVEALLYCRSRGLDIQKTQYYSYLKKATSKFSLRQTALMKFRIVEQHMERVDTAETLERELWRQYESEPLPTKKSQILMRIAVMQPWLMAVYQDAAIITERQAEMEIKQKLIEDATKPKPGVLKVTK